MINILTFNGYYAPEISASMYLNVDVYENLANNGHIVNLVVPTPSRGVDHATRKKYQHLRHEQTGNLHIHRVPLIAEPKAPALRALRYLWMTTKFFCIGLRAKADVMLVHSTPPLQGAMAALLKKLKKVPLVYQLQDIFPDSLVSTGLAKKGSSAWKIGRLIENFTYRNADKIIVISHDFKRNLIAKGVPVHKIKVIYNWVNENAVVNVPRHLNILFDRYNLDRQKFYITHCGNIGMTQNMDMLIDVAARLRDYPDIQFILIGDGTYKTRVQNKINSLNLTNITIIPFQPYEDISHVFSIGDAGLVISKPGVGANSLPSKTWSIMSAERPVLLNFDKNELMHIVTSHKCGLFSPAGDSDTLTQHILTLYHDRALCRNLGRNGRQYVLNHLSTDKNVTAYRREIEQTVQNFSHN